MINIRRAPSYRDQRQAVADDAYFGGDSRDPMEELARLLDDDIQSVGRRGGSPGDMTDALAAEFQSNLGSLDPVDLTGGQGQAQGRARAPQADYQPGYADPWDDDAIEQFAEELAALDESEPDGFPAGVLPSHAAGDMAPEPTPGSRRGTLMAVSSLLVVAIIAGGAWWYYGSSGGVFGEPEIVQAPTGPYKIVPDKGDTIEEPAENNVVFNGAAAKGDERLVTREETVPDLPGVQPQVSRVILPNGQEITPSGEQPLDLGPRRVRTVNVRPDGTMIESGAEPNLPSTADALPPLEPVANPAPAATAALPGATEDIADPIGQLAAAPDLPVETSTTSAVEPVALPGSTETVAPLEPPAVGLRLPPSGEAPEAAPVQAPAETVSAPAENAPLPKQRPAQPAQAVAPAPVAPAEPVQVASVDPVAVPAQEPAPAATPTSGSAAFVQLSSQRSEGAAVSAFQALQKKFPGILGGYAADVQRADLGAKGIYYRARVGKGTRAEAVGLCEQLRAAGGDCIVVKN